MEIPNFETKKELFDFLVKNKKTLIAQKKASVKHADGVHFGGLDGVKVKANKAEPEGNEDAAQVKAAINTTNLLDSHEDVHIPGLWNKSLKENWLIMFVQEHKSSQFDKIIADGDDLKAYAKTYSWKALGFDMEGDTEVLVFEANVKAKRNAFMLNEYREGNVKNHSVGMLYVKLVLCINNEDYGAEFEAWEKYFPMVANEEAAETKGYFWAVTEAKVIEGSAVPLGSNPATPTIDIKKPSEDTSETKPAQATSTEKNIDLIKNFKLY